MDIGAVIAGVILLVVLVRVMAGDMDHSRIDDWFRQRNCKVLHRSWNPFGRGWFGDRSNRCYEVEYEDADGRRHRATVKTSMLSGVYLTDDAVVPAAGEASPGSELERLRAENARLRARLDRVDPPTA